MTTAEAAPPRQSTLLLYAGTIFLSAFLLFLVQPIIAKQILPWFGGSAAVWATCMVFFQVTLLAGYAYADWTTRRLAPRQQALLHGVLLVASLLLLPIVPGAVWKPTGAENPSWQILGLLAATIGLPYLLLSTTTPLVQAWFARRHQHAMPYRLFALSNLASLLALLAYPFAIEPWVTARIQSWTWSACYVAFAGLCIWAAAGSARAGTGAPAVEAAKDAPTATKPGVALQLEWLALAAMGSFMLLAVTNHLCQNIASIPFLWIAPLSIYLASFIFCFDQPRWYQRWVFWPLAAVLLPLMAREASSLELMQVAPLYAGGLFVCCMCCHGELARSKPAPQFLTTFYLMLSIGGAVGGLLVGFAAPYLLRGFFEISIGLAACAALLTVCARRAGWWAVVLGVAVTGGTAWKAWEAVKVQIADAREMRRNFYGAIRTTDSSAPEPFRSLMHGEILHGGQFLELEKRFSANTYFAPTSGFGRLFASLPAGPRKVGVVGLGAGSIIAYARKGDEFRFYEINPQVLELARSEFTFLTQGPAKTEVALGDGRLSLEREPSQQFDVLALDAFSGDAIPLHLLTREAFAIYLKHLKPGGVIILQATNRYVNIAPVVAKLAAEHGLTAVLVSDDVESDPDGTETWFYETDQIIVTANKALLDAPKIREGGKVLKPRPDFHVWTDDYNNLFRVLKIGGDTVIPEWLSRMLDWLIRRKLHRPLLSPEIRP
ncbi:MAG: fused MFS/spermidine synthase [Verrucomicrobia bacterium]|nr:fused MFS/spermidine synthase [Verrucomicrobiota bacterium]